MLVTSDTPLRVTVENTGGAYSPLGLSVRDSRGHSVSALTPVHTISGSLCLARIRTRPAQRLLVLSFALSITSWMGRVKRFDISPMQ